MTHKFFITGATGFIGSNIIRVLVKQGHNVSILTRNKKLNWRLNDIFQLLDIREGNILDTRVEKIIEQVRPDFIFHLASYGVLSREDNFSTMVDTNIRGTANLINAMKKTPPKLFINGSSSGEYGIKEKAMKETDFLAPINDYGITKAAVTLYCQKEAIRNNLPIINFRLFTPYGYFEESNRLMPSVIRSAIKNEPIRVSDSKSVRDFIFIEDVVDAYLQATKISLPKGEIFNIGTGKQHTVGEVVKTALRESKSRSEVLWGTVQKQARFIEPDKWQADISKIEKIMHWKPKYSLVDGIRKTIEWWKENDV